VSREPGLLKADQVCELLSIGRHTLTTLNLPCVRIGSAIRYRPSDLSVFLTETHVVDLAFKQTQPLPRCDLYFIRNIESGRVKIGVTTDTEKRRVALENASGYRMETLGSLSGGGDLECALHVVFRRDRCLGEWFNPSDDLLKLTKKPDREKIMAFLRQKEAEGDIKLFPGKSVLMAYPWKER
jgi:hypothetical protein